MVSTRRSGSMPNNNNNKRSSSSSEHKSPSPKRQKLPNADNGCASEKSTQQEQSQPLVVENLKELSSPPVLDPPENVAEAFNRNSEGDVVSVAKTDAAPAASVVTPTAQGSVPVSAEKIRGSFSLWKQQNQSCEMATPWCRLFAQTSVNQTVTVYTTTFVVGSNKNTNLIIKDTSAILCIIKPTEDQFEGSVVAVLEIKGSKGSVHVNGNSIKKGTTCVLKSGDEVVFGTLGSHAYVSFA